MSEAKSRKMSVLVGELRQSVNASGNLWNENVESIAHDDAVCIVADETACRPKMNDRSSKRRGDTELGSHNRSTFNSVLCEESWRKFDF